MKFSKTKLVALRELRQLHLKQDAVPKFVKARPVAFALRPKVEQVLDKLEKQNILIPVQISDWASPVVPVLKKDGEVRICGDFKVTLNSYLQVDQYPMPKIDEIFQGSYTFFVIKFHDFSMTFPGYFLVFPGPTLSKLSTTISKILSNHTIYHILTFVYEYIRTCPP